MVEPNQQSVGDVVSILLLLPDNFHVPILGWVDEVNLKKKNSSGNGFKHIITGPVDTPLRYRMPF